MGVGNQFSPMDDTGYIHHWVYPSLGISTTPGQASCSGVTDQYIMNYAVFVHVFLIGYNLVFYFFVVVCLFFFLGVFYFALLIFGCSVVLGFCFLRRNLRVGG